MANGDDRGVFYQDDWHVLRDVWSSGEAKDGVFLNRPSVKGVRVAVARGEDFGGTALERPACDVTVLMNGSGEDYGDGSVLQGRNGGNKGDSI